MSIELSLDTRSQARREKTILFVYGLYTVFMGVVSVVLHWGSWVLPVIAAGFFFAVLIQASKFKTYIFRAMITTVLMWVNFSIYLIKCSDFCGTFSTIAAMTVILGIYCVPNVVIVSTVVYTLHIISRFVYFKDVPITMDEAGMVNIIRITSIYLVLYVTYRLTRTQLKSNEMMAEKIEEVKRAERSKDDFMANMSHEIRTPINTVYGISEMVLREDLSPKTREEILDIQIAGRQLLSLVSDILDFSELTSGKVELVEDTYNITSTINDILNMAVAKSEDKDIEIIVDCDADIPSGLVGDEPKIRRAVMNIIDNAIKFTEEGGIIFSVKFREESYGGNLIISVQDTGIGMTEEQVDYIFGSFSQVDVKSTRKNGGMGLGISIAKVIVNQMGGFISAKSEPGQGTEIQMVIPQKVNDTTPVASLKDPSACRAMLYLDMDKYHNAVVRDGFVTCIGNMVKKLGLYYRHAKTLAEFKRRIERENFSHLFVSWKEYCEDREYFEELSKRINVTLVLERDHKESITGSRLLCVYKPFYVLTITSVLNGQYVEHIGRHADKNKRFVAPSAKVLVVDDNLMNLKVVEGLLRPYKLGVTVAESGKEALDKLSVEHFDIIFMDHMMPDMDGIETFHRIRLKPGVYYQNVPVVALTANAIGGAREMFLQEGFADYVAKPIELSALERVLHKFLPQEKIIKEDAQERDEENGSKGYGYKETDTGIDADRRQEKDSGRPDLFQIEGIDPEIGIRYCGGEVKDYLEVIRTYYQVGIKKKEEIRTCYEKNNWKDYTTLVHAVKSTSLGIGAVHLSEIYKEMEAAGKRVDEAYIRAHNEEVLSEYEIILNRIAENKVIFPEGTEEKEAVEDYGSLEEINAGDFRTKLEGLREMVVKFDQDGCREELKNIFKYKYQGIALKKMLFSLEEKVNDFEFVGAEEELEKVKSNL